MTTNKAHIFAQGYQHDEAYIAGTLNALFAIHEALHKALFNGPGEHAKVELMCSDGEGFDLHIICLEDADTWNKLAMPYTDETAAGGGLDNSLWPVYLLKPEDLKP